MASLNYFYNEQIRSYLLQFIRIFGGFQVRTGKGADGVEKMIRIPVRYSDMSRQVGHILHNNAENMLLSCPFMTCHITNIAMAASRRQVPNHISKVQVTEREFDESEQDYTGNIGQKYTVERYMPVPYDLTMELNVWTSNTDQKMQILEQIMALFNPSIDIQTSNNPVDWTVLTYVELQDSITWSERSIPAGTDEAMDVAKMSFMMPIWINPPAKVKRQKIIHQIITNVMEHQTLLDHGSPGDIVPWNGATQLNARVIIIPNQNRIRIVGNRITLLNFAGGLEDENGNQFNWRTLLSQYGSVEAGITQLHLRTSTDLDNTDNDIIGTIELDDDTPNILTWTVDPETLPANTLTAINAIIDPHRTYPGRELPAAASGQRYLFLDDIGPCDAWGDLTASANDIVQYNGSDWVVSFDSSASNSVEYVKNNHVSSQKQYKWSGSEWSELINGEYFPGSWRVNF